MEAVSAKGARVSTRRGQIQALERSQPLLLMRLGQAASVDSGSREQRSIPRRIGFVVACSPEWSNFELTVPSLQIHRRASRRDDISVASWPGLAETSGSESL